MFNWLFDTSKFVPRCCCGDFPPWLRSMHEWSDFAIFFCYGMIPIILAWFWWKGRKRLPESATITLAFAAFIVCCGLGHLIDSYMFTTPNYRLLGFVKLITALVSAPVVFATWAVCRHIINAPSIKEYESLKKMYEAARREWEARSYGGDVD